MSSAVIVHMMEVTGPPGGAVEKPAVCWPAPECSGLPSLGDGLVDIYQKGGQHCSTKVIKPFSSDLELPSPDEH